MTLKEMIEIYGEDKKVCLFVFKDRIEKLIDGLRPEDEIMREIAIESLIKVLNELLEGELNKFYETLAQAHYKEKIKKYGPFSQN